MPIGNRMALAVATGLVLAGTRLSAQAFPAPASADAGAILAELAGSADGWNEADLQKHVAMYVDSVTFMTRQGPRPGADQIATTMESSYFENGKPRQQLSFDNIVQRALGPDHVLMTGNFHLRGGGLDEQQGWFTLVWQRTAEGWRVLHDHSS